MPMLVPMATPLQNAGDARTAAEMTGDDAQVRLADRRLAAVHVKLPRAVGDVLAAEQFRRAFGDELVARAVKSPAADAQLRATHPARRNASRPRAPTGRTRSRTSPTSGIAGMRCAKSRMPVM